MKNSLESLVDDVATYIPGYTFSNDQISKADIGWHIEHILLTINGVISSLAQSNPANFSSQFSLLKNIVLLTNRIPRGKGRVPKVVKPQVAYTEDSLEQHIMATKEKISQLELISEDHFFEHPYFGNMKKRPTVHFLEIHTKHHINIIREIVAAIK